jgi:hypothetical protein
LVSTASGQADVSAALNVSSEMATWSGLFIHADPALVPQVMRWPSGVTTEPCAPSPSRPERPASMGHWLPPTLPRKSTIHPRAPWAARDFCSAASLPPKSAMVLGSVEIRYGTRR